MLMIPGWISDPHICWIGWINYRIKCAGSWARCCTDTRAHIKQADTHARTHTFINHIKVFVSREAVGWVGEAHFYCFSFLHRKLTSPTRQTWVDGAPPPPTWVEVVTLRVKWGQCDGSCQRPRRQSLRLVWRFAMPSAKRAVSLLRSAGAHSLHWCMPPTLSAAKWLLRLLTARGVWVCLSACALPFRKGRLKRSRASLKMSKRLWKMN